MLYKVSQQQLDFNPLIYLLALLRRFVAITCLTHTYVKNFIAVLRLLFY